MDASSLGLLLWTQRCSGGVTEGEFSFFFWNHFNNCMTNASDVCLQAGADVNLPNNIGDTPLHKAAFTGRKVPDCIITSSDFEFLSAFLVSLLIVWVCACIYSSIRSINEPMNQSITYWSGGCHAAAALWCMCYCHQWDSTDSQRCHSKSRDQRHVRRWERHVVI